MRYRPTIIVLAAGAGSRFSGTGHKLQQPLGDSTVIGATLRAALATLLPVVVVTTRRLVPLVSPHVATRDVVLLPEVGSDAAQPLGMGYSIAAGVLARPDAAGWLVMPGDMPLVRPASLKAVAAALEQHPVVYAQCGGRRGHPVGFAAEFYSELVALTGDEGARRVIARYPSVGVELSDPGVLVDIDTPADLAAAQRAGPLDMALPDSSPR